MNARIVTWMAVAAMCLYSSFALPSLPEKFSGTWILDTRATEESVIRNHPYDDVRAFSTELLYMGFTVFEFDGEVATAGPFIGPNKAKYRLSSAQSGKLTYIAENVPGSNNSATLALAQCAICCGNECRLIRIRSALTTLSRNLMLGWLRFKTS